MLAIVCFTKKVSVLVSGKHRIKLLLVEALVKSKMGTPTQQIAVSVAQHLFTTSIVVCLTLRNVYDDKAAWSNFLDRNVYQMLAIFWLGNCVQHGNQKNSIIGCFAFFECLSGLKQYVVFTNNSRPQHFASLRSLDKRNLFKMAFLHAKISERATADVSDADGALSREYWSRPPHRKC